MADIIEVVLWLKIGMMYPSGALIYREHYPTCLLLIGYIALVQADCVGRKNVYSTPAKLWLLNASTFNMFE